MKKLLKGFEVELFTGTRNSHVGISSEIENLFSDFVQEPDNRNIEYITKPYRDYTSLKKSLIQPRSELKKWLDSRNLIIIPSSTLCFRHSNKFQRSDPNNSYHSFIEENYGISIATSSVHINLGIEDLEKLFISLRLIRCEASLFLALSASSPFLNGKYTGNHSQRWIQFPKTPEKVPFFKDHNHYANWIEHNLHEKEMQNIRHFWSSVRPNGPKRPYQLDRLELRICDFVADIDHLIAITALLELRVLYLFDNIDSLDPLKSSKFSLNQLEKIANNNEYIVSKNSLNGELIHWQNGQKVICKEWIQNLLKDLEKTAIKYEMEDLLIPIEKILDEGNQSMKWIEKYKKGLSIEEIINSEIRNMDRK